MSPGERSFPVPAVEAVVARHLPAMIGADLSLLSISDFAAWEVGGRWILRFSHDKKGDLKLRREARLLPWLGDRLPFAVPRVAFVDEWTSGLAVMGYAKLAGFLGQDVRPPDEARPAIAADVAALLAALHGLAPRDIPGIELPVHRAEFAGAMATIANYADTIRREAPDLVSPAIAPFLAGTVSVPAASGERVLSHADLKGEHVLVDSTGTQLVGVIDWADICLADPAVDIGSLAIWLGPAFVEQVAGEYAPSNHRELSERGLFLVRTGMLIGLGERLRGKNDWPLDLLRTQLQHAFAVA